MIHMRFGLIKASKRNTILFTFSRILMILTAFMTAWGCASYPARQHPGEWTILKTPLVEGENVVRANSCSNVMTPSFLGGGDAKFGTVFLTNLRLIYEESQWAKTLAAVGKATPTQGDFGIKHMLKGAYEVFNAHYVIELGNDGKLNVVERNGQIIIPLSDIRTMSLSGSRFSSRTPHEQEKARWLTITTRDNSTFHFEIYNLPPDKTGFMPVYDSGIWKNEIDRVRAQSFHKKK